MSDIADVEVLPVKTGEKPRPKTAAPEKIILSPLSPEEFRQRHGLKRKESNLHEGKEKYLRDFYQRRKRALSQEGSFFGEESEKTYHLSMTEKVAGLILKAQGVTNAGKIVSALAQAGAELGPGKYKELTSKDIVAQLKRLENPAAAFRRVRALGFQISIHSLYSSEFIQRCQELASLSEEEFKRARQEVERYAFFLEGQYLRNCVRGPDKSMHPDLNTLSSIIAQKGLNKEQKRRLEAARRLRMLTGRLVVETPEGKLKELGDIFQTPDKLTQALNSQFEAEKTEQIITVLEQIVFDLENQRGGSLYSSWSPLKILNHLHQSGLLAPLTELITSGWDISYISEATTSLDLDRKEKQEQIKKGILQALALNQLPSEEQEWAAFLSQALQMDPKNIRLAGVYQELLEKKDLLIGVITLAQITNTPVLHLVRPPDERTPPSICSEEFFRLVKEQEQLQYLAPDSGFWRFLGRYLPSNNCAGEEDKLDLAAFLLAYKSKVENQFNINGEPKAVLINGLAAAGLPFGYDRLGPFVETCADPGNLSQEIILNNLPAVMKAIRRLVSLYPGERLNNLLTTIERIPPQSLSENQRAAIEIIRNCRKNTDILLFFANNPDKASQYLEGGKFTAAFLDDFAKTQIEANLRPGPLIQLLFSEDKIVSLAKPGKVFWGAFTETDDPGFQRYLLEQKGNFLQEYEQKGESYLEEIKTAFINEVMIRPELIRSFETLSNVLEAVQTRVSSSSDRAELFLKIAEVLRLVTIDARSEVEDIPALRNALANLYSTEMTPYEKKCWRILQRQLPFSGDESVRREMRDQAEEVERIDRAKLGWTHQVVHNYASIRTLPYLKAFKNWLETGELSEFEAMKELHGGASRAPDYSEDEREELRTIPEMKKELDKLIVLVEQYYTVKPERLSQAITGLDPIMTPENRAQKENLLGLISDLEKATNNRLSEKERETATVSFCLHVNQARSFVLKQAAEEANLSAKTELLILDAVLSENAKQMFSRYSDYLHSLQEIDASQLSEAALVIREVFKMSILEGENQKLKIDFLTKPIHNRFDLRAVLLLLTMTKREIDQNWGRFTQRAQPHMVETLVRMGINPEEAAARAYATDLVDFKKDSPCFYAEPLVGSFFRLAEEVDFPQEQRGVNPSLQKLKEEVLSPPELEIASPQDPKVREVIEELTRIETPTTTEEAKKFLDQLAQSPEARGAKLCLALIPEFRRSTRESPYEPVEITLGKDRVLIYPFSWYHVDGVFIFVNGKQQNPEEYLTKKLRPVKAVLDSLREGD